MKKRRIFYLIVILGFAYIIATQSFQYFINDGNIHVSLENNCVLKDFVLFKVHIDDELILSVNRDSHDIVGFPISYHYTLTPGFHKIAVTCDDMHAEECFFVFFVRYIDISLFTDYNMPNNLIKETVNKNCFLRINLSTLPFHFRRFSM